LDQQHTAHERSSAWLAGCTHALQRLNACSWLLGAMVVPYYHMGITLHGEGDQNNSIMYHDPSKPGWSVPDQWSKEQVTPIHSRCAPVGHILLLTGVEEAREFIRGCAGPPTGENRTQADCVSYIQCVWYILFFHSR